MCVGRALFLSLASCSQLGACASGQPAHAASSTKSWSATSLLVAAPRARRRNTFFFTPSFDVKLTKYDFLFLPLVILCDRTSCLLPKKLSFSPPSPSAKDTQVLAAAFASPTPHPPRAFICLASHQKKKKKRVAHRAAEKKKNTDDLKNSHCSEDSTIHSMAERRKVFLRWPWVRFPREFIRVAMQHPCVRPRKKARQAERFVYGCGKGGLFVVCAVCVNGLQV